MASAESVVWSSDVFAELGWVGQGLTIGGGVDLIEMYIVVLGGQTTLKLQDNSCCSNYSAAYQYLLSCQVTVAVRAVMHVLIF